MVKNITEWLDATAEILTEKISFADDNVSLTFGELKDIARRIGTALLALGLFKKPILVLLENSPRCIAAFCGVAYSGNFYTPVDNEVPASRLQKVIDILKPCAIITAEEYKHLLGALHHDANVLNINQIFKHEVNAAELERVQNTQIDTDLVYVMFTSGSTGMPKGVSITHRALIDYISAIGDAFDITSDIVFGNLTTLLSDKSIKEIYFTLKYGCTTQFIERSKAAFPVKLLQDIEEKKVTALDWVPTVYRYIARSRILPKLNLRRLKLIIFSGEVMHTSTLNAWLAAVPNATYINIYGPTEITGTCTYYKVNRKFADDELLPIGMPYRNIEILVLNEENEIVQADEVGEIHVRSASVSPGYFNNPEKTAEVFVQNPLNTAYHELIYRTGDLAKYNDRGELLYVGRKDFQINHAGYRIELGEIEAIASVLQSIECCACLFEYEEIILFYSGEEEQDNLLLHLESNLPRYMIPRKIIKLDKMPLLPNGKVDRQRLKEELEYSR